MSSMTTDRLQLLKRRMQEKGMRGQGGQGVVRRVRKSPTALSYSQQRLWFLHQMEPESCAFHIPALVRLKGALDVTALRLALGEVVKRHESLRTFFSTVDREPVQESIEAAALDIPLHVLNGRTAQEREALLQALAENQARQPFDLSRAPLMRAALVQLDSDDHALLLTMHHIVSDGWSISVLIREVAALYEAFSKGRPSPLPELEAQYPDYALWQREQAESEEWRRQLAYWKGQLAGGLEPLELPTDRPRPRIQGDSGREHAFRIASSLQDSLRQLAERQSCTLFMTLLAGYQVLLHKLSGQQAVNVGTSSAGRDRPETEGLIGFFLNSLVLRTELEGDPTVRDLLERTRRSAIGAYENQDIPVEALLEELSPERRLDRNPLFQTMFIFQNLPQSALKLPGLELELMSLDKGSAICDLTLTMEEAEEGLAGNFQYNTDLFEQSSIERFTHYLQRVLEQMVDDPERRISSISLLSSAERSQAISASRGEQRRILERPVHELILEQALRSPQATAVRFEDDRIDYSQLEIRSKRVAQALQAQGVGPESLVAIHLQRSPDMIAAVLGTLRSGAAYLPLDPNYPLERLKAILADAAPAALITADDSGEKLDRSLPRIRIDRLANESEWSAEDLRPIALSLDNLAYVIYTSGSTGRPKGVGVTHRSLSNYVQSFAREHSIGTSDCMLQFASLSFDTSAEEIFPALISGASLALRTDSMISTPSHFLQRCRDWEVTLLDLPTAYWHQLASGLESEQSAFPSAIRLVIIGGERALAERLQIWANHVSGDVRLVNTYGPTEATIVASRCDLSRDRDAWTAQIPIGTAVDNVRMYTLDAALQPTPEGVPGEIFIAGAGLARCYSSRPAATALRFPPDPFSQEPGQRMYRSGDLGRRLPNGQLEFRGRADHQVKVRGFRIELGDLESTLGSHPDVLQAAAAAFEESPGEKRLAVYASPKPGAQLERGELRSFLKGRLPDYMLPSFFVILDQLPCTAGGKVDRKALPRPEAAHLESSQAYVAPRSPMEEVLAELWSDVLGVDRVGVRDSFFELGGHSLLATQAIARIRESLQIEVPLQKLFEFHTLGEFAAAVEAAGSGDEKSSAPPLKRAPRDRPLPLSFSQERLWFLHELDERNVSYHVPRAFRFQGRLDLEKMEDAFGDLVRRHEVFRTTFPTIDGKPFQVISPPSQVRIPVVDLSGLPEGDREAHARTLVRRDGRSAFDFENGPMYRLRLLRLGEEDHVLTLVEHHLLHDGWTQGILFREFTELFAARLEGRPSRLAELPIQFADFALWQRQWLQGEELERQLAYWKESLSGAAPLLELPWDRPRPAVMAYRGKELRLSIEGELADAARTLSRREGATLYMLMTAAFKALLSRMTGQEDIVIGSAVANRRWQESEGLAGMIINILPSRTDLSGDPSFREMVRRLRRSTLGTYAHQDLPFEKLVEELQPERSLSYTPIFQAVFNFMDVPMLDVDLPGLQVSGMEAHNGSTKFDLNITVVTPREQAAGLQSEPIRGEIQMFFEYSSELLDESTVRRWMEHYRTLLRSAVADPDQRLSQLPLLDPGERENVLTQWNRTQESIEGPRPLHRLFQEQVRLKPHATAIEMVDGDRSKPAETLSYRELDRRADRIARALESRGVGPGSIVGVCLDRSIDLVASLLGVLKAGAAYLPLDPAYPARRLQFMLDDSGAAAIIATPDLASKMPAADMQVLDPRSAEAGEYDAQALSAGSEEGTDPAYLIYTSGSTGRPKGVPVSHRSAANFLASMRRRPGIGPDDRLLAVTTVSFDIAVLEIFLPLSAGAALLLASGEVAARGDLLAAEIEASRASILQATPATWQMLLAAQWTGNEGLKMLCGGEALPSSLASQLAEKGGELWNLYGPTEATVWCAASKVDSRRAGEESASPFETIGAPVLNTALHVLDAELRPAPIGVPGELHIGGAQLSQGYWMRPGLSALRFLPDPAAGRPGSRIYRSGDRARRLPNGEIEFLGRFDQQVKVRGFRIELGEIETALRQHPAVENAVVTVRADKPGEQTLAAYPVFAESCSQEERPSRSDLRRHLSQSLPEYMLPNDFVDLESLPLTPSGKVDRKALPAPGQRTSETAAYTAPRDELEEKLAAIWQEVLSLDRVGVEDNFFTLGGHSLQATQVIARVRKDLCPQAPLMGLFRKPTISNLADTVRAAQENPSQQPAPIRVRERRARRINA